MLTPTLYNSAKHCKSTEEMEIAREGMAILLNNMWYSGVINFGSVSSRILCIKFKFSRVKFVCWWGTAPMKKLVKKGKGSGIPWTGLSIE